MNMYEYTLALLVEGEIHTTVFRGEMFEMMPRFLLIRREDGTDTLLNHDVVAQLDYKAVK